MVQLCVGQMILAGMSGPVDSPNLSSVHRPSLLYCTGGEEWSWVVGNCPTAKLSQHRNPDSALFIIQQCRNSKYCSVGPEIVFLILVLRESPTVGGLHRNTGSWECNPILTNQPTQSKLPFKHPFSGCVQFSFQFSVDIYHISLSNGKGLCLSVVNKSKGS